MSAKFFVQPKHVLCFSKAKETFHKAGCRWVKQRVK